MQFYRLQYFHRIAQLRSFTKASHELYVAQPALSKQIARLEEELGAKLFDRGSTGINLTDAGKLLFLYTEKLLADWWELKQKIQQVNEIKQNQLRIVVFPTFLWYIIPDLLVKFLRKNSSLNVEIEKGVTAEVTEGILNYHYEAGIVVSPVSHPRLQEYPLYIEEFGLFVSKKHPWYNKNVILAEELDKYPVLIPTLNPLYYRDFIMGLLQKYNIQFEPRLVVHSYEITMQLAQEGMGAALIPLVAYANFGGKDKTVKFLRINPPLQRQIAWIEHRDLRRSFACETFFHYLIKYIQDRPDLPSLLNTVDR